MILSRECRSFFVCAVAFVWIFTASANASNAATDRVDPSAAVSAADAKAGKDQSQKKHKHKGKKKDKDAAAKNGDAADGAEDADGNADADGAAAQEPGTGKMPKHPQVKIGRDVTI